MKKIFVLLMAAVICFSLAACSNGETPNTNDNSNTEQQAENSNDEPEAADSNVTESESTGTESTEPENTEPQYETVEITLDNWQDYFELRLVAFEQRNDFDELTYFFANTQLGLKEEWASIATDMEVAVEYACTNGYLCWFIYNEETGEITEGDIDERYGRTYEQNGTFTMKDYNIQKGYTVFGDTHSVTFEMDGNIAKIKGKMYPDVEIIRIQGTITIER